MKLTLKEALGLGESANPEGGQRYEWGSDEAVTDMEYDIKDAIKMRNRHARWSHEYQNMQQNINRMRNQLKALKRAAAKRKKDQ